jgi:hypothetical protein
LKLKSPVIDGWALYEGELSVSSSATIVPMTITGGNIYIDDIRILPSTSNMKAYVYDAVDRKLVASLDENHLASFFEYNSEGKLVRVKKETEKGVVTLKESRESLRNKFPTGVNPNE